MPPSANEASSTIESEADPDHATTNEVMSTCVETDSSVSGLRSSFRSPNGRSPASSSEERSVTFVPDYINVRAPPHPDAATFFERYETLEATTK